MNSSAKVQLNTNADDSYIRITVLPDIDMSQNGLMDDTLSRDERGLLEQRLLRIGTLLD